MKFDYEKDVIEINGFHDNDLIYKNILKNKSFYEHELLEYMRCVSKRRTKGIVLDLGANIGNHTIYFSKYIATKVISIEANPAVSKILENNLYLNSIKNVRIIKNAVGDQVGQVNMIFPDKDNIGMGRIDNSQEESDCIKVDIDTLDNILAGVDIDTSISFIKLDIEGYEIPALKGALKSIEKYKPDLFVEAATKKEKYDLDSLLFSLGYTMFFKKADTPVYHYVFKPSLYDKLYINLCNFLLKIKSKIIK